MRLILIFITAFMLLQFPMQAQVFNPWGPPPNDKEIEASFLRKILSHFSAEVAIGYGNTRYRQNLDDYSIYSDNGQLYLLAADSASGQPVGIGNWLNKPFVTDTINTSNAIVYNPSSNEQDPNRAYLIDSGEKRLTGGGNAVPLHLKLHFNYDRYRIGAGATFEFNTKAKMDLKGYPDYINKYESDFSNFLTRKYYFTAGVRYWDFWDFSYFADVEYGRFRLSNNAFPASNVTENSYWNVGFPVEKNLSKYFHLVMRPSIDLKSINTVIPSGEAIKTNMWNLQFQVGVRVSFPLYRKCPISNCEAQKEHKHIDKKFRGQPLHKIQNPKVGQNHPYLATQKRGLFSFLKRK
ncbi:hypothetical protein JKA74_15275 [Marivirga sp. S37H4]|uniref:Outer membrane protein beta-barrel domain-containing protein n=1 Tax=Marivirga aurantiaca TaxID=2802615 RepID=A0A934X136_9BACT|nr:hypothetical protein [Marivirga aurantiaca]MBK6266405.1 hypothetical protein [Marivirga aurantiaca]